MAIFKDKISIVTGGASGIGRGLVGELASRGAKVVLADINGDAAKKAAEMLNGEDGNVKPATLDVTDYVAVKKLVDDTVSEYGRLDYMFNNAGVAMFGEARDYSYEDWRKVIDVDLYGPVNGVAAAYGVMVEQGFGHIVNTASIGGMIPATHLTSYVTSKYGIVGLSHTLRMEGAALGVKVSVVCPGLIRTAMYESPCIRLDQTKLLNDAPKGMPPEKCARVILKGVERNKATIIVTLPAKIAYILHRISPNLMIYLGSKVVGKTRKSYRVEN